MAKGIDTNTIVMLGGLAALGVGLFYMMNKQSGSMEDRINAATNMAMGAAGASNPAQLAEMRAAIAEYAAKSTGMSSWEKSQAEKALTAQYVGMGIGGAAAIAAAIADIFKQTGPATQSGAPTSQAPLGWYFNPTTGIWQPR